MNQELIKRLAQEAGMQVMPRNATTTVFYISLEQQAAFAALVAEECAKLVEQKSHQDPCAGEEEAENRMSAICAAAIRERFKP